MSLVAKCEKTLMILSFGLDFTLSISASISSGRNPKRCMPVYIRSVIADKYGKQIAEDTSILYGGSCKPSNAAELFAKPDIDGGLIGGASLKVADFKGIIDAWKK